MHIVTFDSIHFGPGTVALERISEPGPTRLGQEDTVSATKAELMERTPGAGPQGVLDGRDVLVVGGLAPLPLDAAPFPVDLTRTEVRNIDLGHSTIEHQ